MKINRIKTLFLLLFLFCTLIFSNCRLVQGKDDPKIISEIRTYGEPLDVWISDDGDLIATEIKRSDGSFSPDYYIQLYSNSELVWELESTSSTHIYGFMEDNLILEEYDEIFKLDTNGNKSVIFTGMPGLWDTVGNSSYKYKSPSSHEPTSYDLLRCSKEEFRIVMDEGEHDQDDQGVCLLSNNGSIIWRYAVEYPLEISNVIISPQKEYVLIIVGYDSYFFLDINGNLLGEESDSKIGANIENIGEITCSQDGRYFISKYEKTDDEKGFLVLDADFNLILTQEYENHISDLLISSNGYGLVVEDRYKNTTISQFNISGDLLWTYSIEEGAGISMNSDGSLIALASEDSYIYVIEGQKNLIFEPDPNAPQSSRNRFVEQVSAFYEKVQWVVLIGGFIGWGYVWTSTSLENQYFVSVFEGERFVWGMIVTYAVVYLIFRTVGVGILSVLGIFVLFSRLFRK
jgi:hypothetical protein